MDILAEQVNIKSYDLHTDSLLNKKNCFKAFIGEQIEPTSTRDIVTVQGVASVTSASVATFSVCAHLYTIILPFTLIDI